MSDDTAPQPTKPIEENAEQDAQPAAIQETVKKRTNRNLTISALAVIAAGGIFLGVYNSMANSNQGNVQPGQGDPVGNEPAVGAPAEPGMNGDGTCPAGQAKSPDDGVCRSF